MKPLCLFLAIVLAGCATQEDRFLTKEEDAHLREKCAETNCVIVPVPVWQEILKLLGRKSL